MRYWLPVLLYLGLILAVSSIPGRTLAPLRLASWDKLAHAVEYGILSVLLARALREAGLRRGAPAPRTVALLAVLGAVAWGAIDESYQHLTHRVPDAFDLVADAVGAILVQARRLAARAGSMREAS